MADELMERSVRRTSSTLLKGHVHPGRVVFVKRLPAWKEVRAAASSHPPRLDSPASLPASIF